MHREARAAQDLSNPSTGRAAQHGAAPAALRIGLGLVRVSSAVRWRCRLGAGAAVCPPNFFLQSALVCTRRSERSTAGVLEAFEYNLYETSICLGLATLINAVMLVLAAAHFYPTKVGPLAPAVGREPDASQVSILGTLLP